MKDYDDYLQQQENAGKIPSQLTNKLRPFHILIIMGIFFIISKLVNQGQKSWIWIVLVGLAVIYIFSLLNQSKEKKPIPRHIAERIAKNDLQRQIDKSSSFTHGTEIIPTGIFKAGKIDNVLTEYHLGFIVKEPNKGPKDWVYQMNAYPPGECYGIRECLLGFTGNELPDIKLLVPEKIIKEEPEENK